MLVFYDKQEQRVPLQQIEKIERMYKEVLKDYTVKVYDAGHAFINPDHGTGNGSPLAVSFLKEKLK